ncbi:response regulator [Clostridium thailandense]|uniref:Response regulator n=1 Tax=Clostridium thailandense TaxID=2794346 RepID=A0A949WTN7_9CLOT|nr:response regulator [Clostridium thailandense]MBV7271687.1 response regulator [Clostridium thailandense]MCH5136342.1 response regulator [Clostridiaceae bacterium UIB06]
MNFFIVDDDEAIRSMLEEIIEDYDLGNVVGEADNGSIVDSQLLRLKKVDILIIDLLMPIRDGIQTINDLDGDFSGKIIMISQVEDKQMVGKSYSLGVEYYITKPINRLEVVSVIQKVIEHVILEKSVSEIRKTLNILEFGIEKNKTEDNYSNKNITLSGQFLLTELGMIGESGSSDLLDMLEYLSQYEKQNPFDHEFPPLKDIFTTIATKKLGGLANQLDLQKEIKASEQRVRRAIFQALIHLASLGLTDYSNPRFEEYATKFFDFTEVRKVMLELKNDVKPSISRIRINTKKFVKVLFLEAKKEL